MQAECDAVNQRLETCFGLPPREKLADPQQALLQALTAKKSPTPVKKKGGPCDKCDGPHHEDDCPFFNGRLRTKHKDAWDRYGSKAKASDSDSGNCKPYILKSARIVPQPGDGSCLFHSIAYGLPSCDATKLRAEVADYIAGNPEAMISDNPLKDWVLWDSGTDVKSYAKTMRTGSRWGGAVEIAVCALLKHVAVHVYEKGSKGFVHISTFGDDILSKDRRAWWLKASPLLDPKVCT